MPGLICGGMENVILRCAEWWWHSEQLSTALLLVRKKAKLCLAAATVKRIDCAINYFPENSSWYFVTGIFIGNHSGKKAAMTVQHRE